MCDKRDKVYLPTPVWMKRKRRATIEVDACCAEVLTHLWENGIDTLYHCCGHWSGSDPYLILAAGCTESVDTIKKLIKQVDNREWRI